MNEIIIATDFEAIKLRINAVIAKAISENNPEIALGEAKELVTIHNLSGQALAYLIYELYKAWDEFDWGDDFFDTVSTYLGVERHTAERYVKLPAMLKSAPDEFRPKLENMGVNLLIPVANAVSQGYEVNNQTWKKLTNCTTDSQVREIIRTEVKQSEPRSNAIRLWLDREGSIYAYKLDERFFIGSLEVADQTEVVQHAIRRIVNNSGMLQEAEVAL